MRQSTSSMPVEVNKIMKSAKYRTENKSNLNSKVNESKPVYCTRCGKSVNRITKNLNAILKRHYVIVVTRKDIVHLCAKLKCLVNLSRLEAVEMLIN